jgi:hypothetical protein
MFQQRLQLGSLNGSVTGIVQSHFNNFCLTIEEDLTNRLRSEIRGIVEASISHGLDVPDAVEIPLGPVEWRYSLIFEHPLSGSTREGESLETRRIIRGQTTVNGIRQLYRHLHGLPEEVRVPIYQEIQFEALPQYDGVRITHPCLSRVGSQSDNIQDPWSNEPNWAEIHRRFVDVTLENSGSDAGVFTIPTINTEPLTGARLDRSSIEEAFRGIYREPYRILIPENNPQAIVSRDLSRIRAVFDELANSSANSNGRCTCSRCSPRVDETLVF